MQNRKISISTPALQRNFGDFGALDVAKKAGADAIDFDISSYSYKKSGCMYSKSEDEILEYYTSLKKHADDIELEIGQTHGRILGPIVGNEEHNDEELKNARLDCMVTKALGAPVTVFHPCCTKRNGKDADQAELRRLTHESFCKYLPCARECGVTIAIETCGTVAQQGGCMDFYGNIYELLTSYNKLCAVEDFSKYLKLCVDTGHTNMTRAYNFPTAGDTIRIFGGKNLAALHMHDNNIARDLHQMPLVGAIDWDDVLTALDDIGYTGNYNLEVSLGYFGKALVADTAEFVVKVFKNMLYEKYGE